MEIRQYDFSSLLNQSSSSDKIEAWKIEKNDIRILSPTDKIKETTLYSTTAKSGIVVLREFIGDNPNILSIIYQILTNTYKTDIYKYKYELEFILINILPHFNSPYDTIIGEICTFGMLNQIETGTKDVLCVPNGIHSMINLHPRYENCYIESRLSADNKHVIINITPVHSPYIFYEIIVWCKIGWSRVQLTRQLHVPLNDVIHYAKPGICFSGISQFAIPVINIDGGLFWKYRDF